ncbi:putative geraniol 8-hydroxylase [Rosa chinensis]|uniref:Putative geraniol 8-hydroxylase n=1 Tax=Rosa chinensis TaxID=74649 RepID=A0A2P6P7M4_ROSCH|nr:putative geraniol 8-hydroxylase [Rosa chinensis]
MVRCTSQLELCEVIGKGNPVEELDIARLPYLQAIIKETFRLHQGPFLLPRKAELKVEIEGLTIPNGAQVLVNVWAIGRDPTLWDDPYSFKPNRFLGFCFLLLFMIQVITVSEDLCFRMCPGLPLAMRMLHLMLGSLIHSFVWKLEDGVTPENMNIYG